MFCLIFIILYSRHTSPRIRFRIQVSQFKSGSSNNLSSCMLRITIFSFCFFFSFLIPRRRLVFFFSDVVCHRRSVFNFFLSSYSLQVLPGLYVGNYRDSKDNAQLERHGITHIIAIHDAARKLHHVSFFFFFIYNFQLMYSRMRDENDYGEV